EPPAAPSASRRGSSGGDRHRRAVPARPRGRPRTRVPSWCPSLQPVSGHTTGAQSRAVGCHQPRRRPGRRPVTADGYDAEDGPLETLDRLDGTTTVYRTCPLCEATCGLELAVRGREIVRVRGDR